MLAQHGRLERGGAPPDTVGWKGEASFKGRGRQRLGSERASRNIGPERRALHLRLDVFSVVADHELWRILTSARSPLLGSTPITDHLFGQRRASHCARKASTVSYFENGSQSLGASRQWQSGLENQAKAS